MAKLHVTSNHDGEWKDVTPCDLVEICGGTTVSDLRRQSCAR